MGTVSRSKHLVRNVSVTLLTQVLLLVFSFVNRTIFISLLGAEYLGLDGLFASLLTVFSLAELGIGNAIIYDLYKPIALGDTKKSTQYISLFRRAYNIIIIVILCLGILVIPFLNKIVNADSISVEINVEVIYILFLFNTVSSYFLAHKQTILVVNQRQSTVSLVQTSVKIIVSILECIIILLLHNYYIYLIVRILGNYFQAIWISIKAQKEYPDLCKKNKERLSKEEIGKVKQNVWALFIRRIGGVVLSTTDNLVINAYISIKMVGIYSNYVLIITAIQTITVQFFNSMTATIGNFVAIEDKKESEKLFEQYTFLVFIVYGICSSCFISLTNRFVELLWGKNYLLTDFTLLLIVVNYFLFGFQAAINSFRDTTGLFVQGKYRGLFSAAVNVIASIIFAKYWGVAGIVLGTIVSRLLVSLWYDPYILYKNFFGSSVRKYYVKLLLYFIVTFTVAIGIKGLLTLICNSVINFVFCTLLCMSLSSLIVIPFIRTNEFRACFCRVKEYSKALFLRKKVRRKE